MVDMVQTQYLGNSFWSPVSSKLRPQILKPNTAVQKMVGDAKSEGYLIKSCSLSSITEVFL